MISYSRQYLLIASSILMIVSCFLPWVVIGSSLSYLGMNAGYSQSVIGIQNPIGQFTAIVACIAFVMGLLKSKWIVLPGAVNLLIAVMVLFGMPTVSINLDIISGTGYSGVGIGVYILLIASLCTLIVSLPLFNESAQILPRKDNSESHDVSKDHYEPLKPAIPDFRTLLIPYTRIFITGILLIILFLIGFGIFNFSQEKKWAKIQKEQNRLGYIRSSIHLAIEKRNWDEANLLINSFHWSYDAEAYTSYVKNVEEEAKMLRMAVTEGQRADNTLSENFKIQEAVKTASIEQQYTDLQYPFRGSISPVFAKVFEQATTLSTIKTQLPQNKGVDVITYKNQYFFCKFTVSESSEDSGWVYFEDVGR